MRPQAVVFDLDGLMFNTEELYVEVASEVLRRRGAVFSRDLHAAMMGRPARDGLRIMIEWCGLKDTPEQIAAESSEVFYGILPTRLAPMPGVLNLLAALERAELPKAICTSSSRQFVDTVLALFDLQPRFAFKLCAEDVTRGKPDPEIYLTAAARLGKAPADVLVLEDSQTGFTAARNAGTIAVAVPGAHNEGQTYDGAALVLETLADARLYDLLKISS